MNESILDQIELALSLDEVTQRIAPHLKKIETEFPGAHIALHLPEDIIAEIITACGIDLDTYKKVFAIDQLIHSASYRLTRQHLKDYIATAPADDPMDKEYTAEVRPQYPQGELPMGVFAKRSDFPELACDAIDADPAQ